MRLNQAMRIGPTFVLLFGVLAACGDWPDIETPGASRGTIGDWPVLGSLSNGNSSGPAADPQNDAGEALSARATSLRARAAILRTPVADQAAFEALRARLAAR